VEVDSLHRRQREELAGRRQTAEEAVMMISTWMVMDRMATDTSQMD